MVTLNGKSICKGLVMGRITVLNRQKAQMMKRKVESPEAEILRLAEGVRETQKQLQKLYEKVALEAGEKNAAIFDAYQLILEDEDYLSAVKDLIRTESVSAEYGAAVVGDKYSRQFAGMEDEVLKARAEDIKDVSNRLVANLTGEYQKGFEGMSPSILVAEDVTPSEIVQMERDKILALVIVYGSSNSHIAILARSMNIPALIRVPINLGQLTDGMTAVVDGFQGEVILEPSEEILCRTKERIQEKKEQEKLLQALRGKEAVTLDGQKISIYANIGAVCEVKDALEQDAEGIGLFRSELLYLGRKNFPGEEEQLQAYRQVLQAMGGKKVVIRTLDVGADKLIGGRSPEQEANPAMGFRSIRICLKHPDIFKIQLRALLRSAVFGNLSILYPMITSVEEVKKIYGIVDEVKGELGREKLPFRVPKQGIMVETPAAVMISDELAKLVDFFSIGTNDLTQYTLAIDRQNERLEEFYDPRHKAVLKMIQMVVENGHRAGKPVGICGELGADLEMTEKLLELCVDELSVAPSMVLQVKEKVRGINLGRECFL